MDLKAAPRDQEDKKEKKEIIKKIRITR